MLPIEKIHLPGVKNIIIVASGKGGVGKSTVSSNLAVTLARRGFKTALVDADIYGPSVPRMFGIEDARPQVIESGEKQLMIPIEKHGVEIMSIGFFVERNQGLIWRGPMAANAITQLFENSKWENIDYMVIDFPPGTGDIQLTTVQKLSVKGALIITTPQEISLNDVRKACSLFMNKDLNVPILGVVENMSWFTPAKHPDEKYYIFGQGGGQKIAEEIGSILIAQIPLVTEVGEAAEKGLSIFSQPDIFVAELFENIVTKLTKV